MRKLTLILFWLLLLAIVATAQGVLASRIRIVTFANLGTPADGNVRYCSDCAATTPCTGSGTGNMASRVNGAWNCSVAAAGGSVTSIATTSPITGGTITTTGTIACATCGVTGTGLSQFAATTSAGLRGVLSDEMARAWPYLMVQLHRLL